MLPPTCRGDYLTVPIDAHLIDSRAVSGPRWTCTALFALLLTAAAPSQARERMPNVVIITIDALRADRLAAYGYQRPTSPNIDRVLASGARFNQARTIEPLTNPAIASVLTSLYPHEHGAVRNGIRMRRGLESLPLLFGRRGFATAAFVGSWPLRDKLSGLGEHFETFEEVLTRKRWFVFLRESTAGDVNEASLQWLEEQRKKNPGQPFFLWVHYVEPHAPYRTHDTFRAQLGLPPAAQLGKKDRYDTEIAAVDRAVGQFLDEVRRLAPANRTVVVVTADHGESLGEHDYWGHGRNLYEPSLRIPLGISWPGTIAPQQIDVSATLIDIAPTLLGLAGHPIPQGFRGFDWSPRLRDGKREVAARPVLLQAHRGAVKAKHDSERKRRRGLLEVGLISGQTKEIRRQRGGVRLLFDLTRDPRELSTLSEPGSPTSTDLAIWSEVVERGLEDADVVPTEALSDEEIERMRALGYID